MAGQNYIVFLIKELFENVHVLPLGAVLLKSFAFSIAALPTKINKLKLNIFHNSQTKEQLTLFNQILFIIDNADIIFGQILDCFVRHFPKLLRNLTD